MIIKGDRKMTNGAKFAEVFNDYATEIWAKPMKEFLEWLDAPYESRAHWEKQDSGVHRCSKCGAIWAGTYSDYCAECEAEMNHEVMSK